MIFKKERFDREKIFSKIAQLQRNKSRDFKLHVFYAGTYYNEFVRSGKLKSFLLQKLRSRFSKSVMLTMLRMSRDHLITQEKMKNITRGLDLKEQEGVCDDLEHIYEKIKAGKCDSNDQFSVSIYAGKVEETQSYFLQKLTENEMQLVDMKDENHLATYSWYYAGHLNGRQNPDVDEKEMKLSHSESKYVKFSCQRKTFRFSTSETYKI